MNRQWADGKAGLHQNNAIESRIAFARLAYLKAIYAMSFPGESECQFSVGPIRASTMTIFFEGAGAYCLTRCLDTSEDQHAFVVELEKLLLESRGRQFVAIDFTLIGFLGEEMSEIVREIAVEQEAKGVPLCIAGLRKKALQGVYCDGLIADLSLIEVEGVYYRALAGDKGGNGD